MLHRAPLLRVGLHPCGCGCAGNGGCDERATGLVTGLVQAILPEHEAIGAVRIIRGETEVWSRRATAEPPRISDVSAELDGETLRIRWQAWVSDQYAAERAARWSRDDGRTWEALAVRLFEDEAIVPVGSLASGPAVIQVLVSDGFHTTVSESLPIKIPPRAPPVAILWPIQGGAVQSGKALRLWGTATGSDGRTLPAETLLWDLDAEPAGTGAEAWVDLPDWEGEHRVTLRVQHGCEYGEASVTFFATWTGYRPQRRARE